MYPRLFSHSASRTKAIRPIARTSSLTSSYIEDHSLRRLECLKVIGLAEWHTRITFRTDQKHVRTCRISLFTRRLASSWSKPCLATAWPTSPIQRASSPLQFGSKPSALRRTFEVTTGYGDHDGVRCHFIEQLSWLAPHSLDRYPQR